VQLQSEIESYKKSRDESDADRENEIRRIFDPMADSNQESDVSLENERLKNDLNQVLSWKTEQFKVIQYRVEKTDN
jgi:hypothetical protein